MILACHGENDLAKVLAANGLGFIRCDDSISAANRASPGEAVLVLAEEYPDRQTPLPPEFLSLAGRKGLRVYVEFPLELPGLTLSQARPTPWERAVVSSDWFGPELPQRSILCIHGCHFLPVSAPKPHIVAARVAGFDSAVFGLPAESFPILLEHSPNVLVATSKLSQFVTGRYAPQRAWEAIWRRILAWLTWRDCESMGETPMRHMGKMPMLRWKPAVRPSFADDEPLPADAELQAARRGARWFFNSRMFMHPSWQDRFAEAAKYKDRVAPAPSVDWPSCDGSLGVLEGFSSRVEADGRQLVRWWQRNDCTGETAGAMALAGRLGVEGTQSAGCGRIAANLNDFIYHNSILAQGPRANPASPSFGLVGWDTTGGDGVYYGDDNARSMMGTILSAGLLGTDRWDLPVLRCLLANLRTTGKLGFRGNRLEEAKLQATGWRHHWEGQITNYAPHYECHLWACFLWAYARTGFEPFLDRARSAIRLTMAAYPHQWKWANGIQQERARMLLPLAWLVRLEDTAEHRGWLRRVAEDMLAIQDDCGAIREEVGSAGLGSYGPPKSNEEYGTSEATLIQSNGDRLTDLLYTANFAFLGLHEAIAATGEDFYRQRQERLAKLLCRIQIRSETHPELDGGWFRAFDYGRWEYLASNADAGWGAWSIETGWTQAWIVSVLAMRQLKTSLWEATAAIDLRRHLATLAAAMLPGEEFA